MKYILIPLDMCAGDYADIVSRVFELADDASIRISDKYPEHLAEGMLHALGLKVVSELRGDLDEFEEG